MFSRVKSAGRRLEKKRLQLRYLCTCLFLCAAALRIVVHSGTSRVHRGDAVSSIVVSAPVHQRAGMDQKMAPAADTADLVAASSTMPLGFGQGTDLRPSAIISANSVTHIEHQWELYFNQYLNQFQQSPISLDDKASELLITRLRPAKPLDAVSNVPLVSVLMTTWNSESRAYAAAMSILQQTWSSIELIIVDDASTDGTWQVLEDIAAAHENVQVMRNVVNVGPYVSKNIALLKARGAYVTCQDSDDWSHPQRIELQMRPILESFGRVRATIAQCVRISDDLHTTIHRTVVDREPEFRWSSLDGVMHTALISLLVDRQWMLQNIGSWDSLAYGADGEMLHRVGTMVGHAGLVSVHAVGIVVIARKNSLSHQGGGYDSPMSSRNIYKRCYADWHDTLRAKGDAFLPFPPSEVRLFPAPNAAVIDRTRICANMEAHGLACDLL